MWLFARVGLIGVVLLGCGPAGAQAAGMSGTLPGLTATPAVPASPSYGYETYNPATSRGF